MRLMKSNVLAGIFLDVLNFNTDQKRFMVSQILSTLFNSIISGLLMTGFLLFLGVSEAKVGVILSIPLLASFLQVPLAKMWYCFGDSKQKIIRMVLVSRLLILSIVLLPLLIPKKTVLFIGSTVSLRVITAFVILLFAYVFASSSGIQQNYWMVCTIDPDIRGTFLAFRDKIVCGLAILISLAASYTIDLLKKTSNEYIGFVIIFTVAAVLAVIDYNVLAKINYEEDNDTKSNISMRQWIMIIKEDKRYLGFLIYTFFLNFSLNISGPYYNVYMLNQLHLNYTRIMMLTALQVIIQISISSRWGKMAGYIKWKNILSFTTMILGIQYLIVWPLVMPKTIGLITVIFITSGLIATGLSISQFMIPYEYINTQSAMIYLSMNTAVSALGGFLGSITGSNIISGLGNIKIIFHSVDFGAMQINMMVSGIMILLSVCYSRFILKK